jgi:hypothetical protein
MGAVALAQLLIMENGYELAGRIPEKADFSRGGSRLVKSGDYISFSLGREAYAIGLAIASRMDELKDVEVFQPFPGNCADYVVTEYGIAHLRGKSLRRRAEELVAIAHPDFRAELRKEAQKLYWP